MLKRGAPDHAVIFRDLPLRDFIRAEELPDRGCRDKNDRVKNAGLAKDSASGRVLGIFPESVSRPAPAIMMVPNGQKNPANTMPTIGIRPRSPMMPA